MAGPVRHVRRRRDACHATIHAQQLISRLEPGTTVKVRTSEPINASAANGRVYTGVIDQDVLDNTGRAGVVLIQDGKIAAIGKRNQCR